MAIYAIETWKPVVGFEGYYEVSDWGHVRSVTREHHAPNFNKTFEGKRLSMKANPHGYVTVSLCVKGQRWHKRVHRLVAEAFMPNPENLPEVNHMNGDKEDNSYEFLEWCTPSQNKQHAFDTGLKKPVIGSKHGHAKINEEIAYDIKILLKSGKYTQPAIAKIFNISRGIVDHIHRGGTWRHIQLKY